MANNLAETARSFYDIAGNNVLRVYTSRRKEFYHLYEQVVYQIYIFLHTK